MQTPPADLAEDELVAALGHRWAIRVAALEYRPVGFGSHHWAVTDTDGARWFATVDDLPVKRRTADEPLAAAYARLVAALDAARDLRDAGLTFVVAPVPARHGASVIRLAPRYALALYPYVAGESFDWGEYPPGLRRAVLDLVVAVHTAPAAVRRRALADDFVLPHRDELAAALAGDDPGDIGPYAGVASRLIAAHAPALRRRLARYDDLAAAARANTGRALLTHGEPHPGNAMRTPDGWLLIDWDTALIAPPERDLWLLDPGDGSIVDAYAVATGVTADPAMLELYRLRWHLADIAVETRRFRRRHTGTADDDDGWQILRNVVAHVATPDGTVLA